MSHDRDYDLVRRETFTVYGFIGNPVTLAVSALLFMLMLTVCTAQLIYQDRYVYGPVLVVAGIYFGLWVSRFIRAHSGLAPLFVIILGFYSPVAFQYIWEEPYIIGPILLIPGLMIGWAMAGCAWNNLLTTMLAVIVWLMVGPLLALPLANKYPLVGGPILVLSVGFLAVASVKWVWTIVSTIFFFGARTVDVGMDALDTGRTQLSSIRNWVRACRWRLHR